MGHYASCYEYPDPERNEHHASSLSAGGIFGPEPQGCVRGVPGQVPPENLSVQRHYTSLTPEPIDVIEGWGLGFRLANAIKYIARAGRKPGQPAEKDLEKAIRYLRREINAIRGIRSWD